MANQIDLEKIKKITEEFFEEMGFEIELEISSSPSGAQKEETISINLRTKNSSEAAILIGEKGETLSALQHLLKAILKKKINGNFYLDLDINDYKKKKIEYLKKLARSIAKEVVITGREKELTPMLASERRIIHLELAEEPDITTQSIGKEPYRRVIIRPYP
jgi:spoIIIJ-associated protein